MDESLTVRQWISVVRRARLGRTIKMVALALATYADPDGSRVHPGIARLSFECELSYTGVKTALRKLRSAGLIRKVGRVGEADDYQLILHEDLLERVDVPTPSQSETEINRTRQQWRGTYVPTLRTDSQTAEPDDETDLRSAKVTAETGGSDPSAVTSATADDGPAVTFSTSLRSPLRTATYQDHTTTTTNHSEEDLSTDVTVVGGSLPNEDPDFELAEGGELRESIHGPLATVIPIMPKRGPCPHGNSPRRRGDGKPRCDECRNQVDASDPLPDLGASKCVHGLKVALNGDGQPRCFACRRGLPGAV